MEVADKKWRLGVPRALFYYYYAPWWKAFFEDLGLEVLISPPTSKEILDIGVSLAVVEACLPVKVYYGHAAWLSERVDALFVPRLVSVERKSFICPKLMGLPDMLRTALKPCPKIIDSTINLSRNPQKGLETAVRSVARTLGFSGSKVLKAKEKAEKCYKAWLAKQREDKLTADTTENPINIGIVGHGYLLYDRYLGMDIPHKVQKLGGRVYLPENLTDDEVEEACRVLPKRLYWTLGQKNMGAVLNFMERDDIDGIIHLTAFGCGPDSMVGELAERYARRCGKPFLLLNLDEHTGEAGLNTRLEAFVDMLTRRCSA